MKRLQFLSLAVLLFTATGTIAQELESTEQEKISYYEQRAKEDAQFEQSQELAEQEEEEFWESQKEYESRLKKRNKRAYRAYMKGKKDAYAEHRGHCDTHCHHSEQYHAHASFYYYNNDPYRYRNYNRGTTIRTGIGVRAPSVRIGL
jgi:basic membrane lipoprotein Med (substrate-binding protein (PBP1-ABC) superfamily)